MLSVAAVLAPLQTPSATPPPLWQDESDALVGVRNRWIAATAAVGAGDDLGAYLAGAVPEALQALEDACVPEAEQGAWLDAL